MQTVQFNSHESIHSETQMTAKYDGPTTGSNLGLSILLKDTDM